MTQRTECVGVVVGPGVVERQYHPPSAALSGREKVCYLIERHNGEPTPMIGQYFQLPAGPAM